MYFSRFLCIGLGLAWVWTAYTYHVDMPRVHWVIGMLGCWLIGLGVAIRKEKQ